MVLFCGTQWNLALRELAEATPPEFDQKEIFSISPWNHRLFYHDDYEKEIIRNAEVNLNNVVGHTQMYPYLSWNKLLFSIRRSTRNLEKLEGNPEYYLSGSPKSDWTFIDIDGSLFIDQGKHRTGILRYLAHFNPRIFYDGPIAKGVTVTKRHVDHDTMDYTMEIQALLKEEPFSHLTFSYNANWMGDDQFSIFNKRRPRNYQHDQRYYRFTKHDLPYVCDELSTTTRWRRLFEGGSYKDT